MKGGPPNGYLSGTNSRGELYEGWYDSFGDIKWSRHHSHHNMMECLTIVDQVANRNEALFYEGFKIIYDYVKDHPWLPYAK